MADSQGLGFTASIVNSIPNYVAADQSVLGQIDGRTAAIQYVKLVWGGSGEANFVTDDTGSPSPLPVSLNNADNQWLVDAFTKGIVSTGGVTAFNVSIANAAGLCFGTVNLSLGSGLTITAVAPGVSGIGVTFGKIGISGDFMPVRNWVSALGVTESLTITGGAYVLGGTVNVGSISGTVNFGTSGITLSGISLPAGASLPVRMAGGTVDSVIGTVNTRIVGMSAATLGVVLTNEFGGWLGNSTGIPFFGVSGATAVGVTFGGVGVTFGGVTFGGVTFGTVGITTGTVGVTFGGITFGGVTLGTVGVTFGGVTFTDARVRPVTGVTFGTVLVQPNGTPFPGGNTGIPVFGVSGATAIPVIIMGGLSGITVTGLAFPTEFGISGGTLNAIRGGTLDTIGLVRSIGFVSGGTVNIGNQIGVTVNNQVRVFVENTQTDPLLTRLVSWDDNSGVALIDALEGLTVTVEGFGSNGLVISGFSAGLEGIGGTGLGTTFGPIRIAAGQSIAVTTNNGILVEGSSDSRNGTAPVGVTFGGIVGSTLSRRADYLMGICLAGVTTINQALAVNVIGGLSGITVTGFATNFGVSGGTLDRVLGGTLDTLRLLQSVGFVSGGTVSVTNLVGVTVTNSFLRIRNDTTGYTLAVVLTPPDGTLYNGITYGIPVFGITNAPPLAVGGYTNANPVAVYGGTLSRRADFLTGVSIPFPISFQQSKSGAGSTLAVTLVDPAGNPITGGSYNGIPIFGVQGLTAVGVTFNAITFGSGITLPFGLTHLQSSDGRRWLGVTFTGSLTTIANVEGQGVRIAGICAGPSFGLPVYLTSWTGNTNYGGIPIYGLAGATNIGVTMSTPVVVRGVSGATLPVVLTTTSGLPFTGGDLGIPIFGVQGVTAIGVTFGPMIPGLTHTFAGGTWMRISPLAGVQNEPGITIVGGPVRITGLNTESIGVTLNVGGAVWVTNNETRPVWVTGGVGITTSTGIPVRTLTGTTLGVVLVSPTTTLAFTGGNLGIPIFGVQGLTAVGVTFTAITFGAITFGSVGMAVTFSTSRTIITGTSFADGGGNLGMPVYGVAGSTAVRVQIEGGTVYGLFSSDSPGITIQVGYTGGNLGIPIFGVQGLTAVGVTFGGITQTGLFGITWTGAGGVTFGAMTGSVHILGTPTVAVGTINQVTTISNDVPVKPGTAMTNATKLLGATTDAGVIVTQKHGSMFMVGLTLSTDFITQTRVTGFTGQWGLSFGGGNTAWYFRNDPVCITKNYTGPYTDGTLNADGFPNVPLKEGLWIQFTKWDLISHVLVGYTAGTTYAFHQNAQLLHREYQAMPMWGNALNQFKLSSGDTAGPMVGMIEKPTRIFLPCKNAADIYILPVGDYRNHTVGAGFWNYDGGTADWSEFTLYERSWFASDYAGITGYQQGDNDGGGPNIGINGEPAFGMVSFNAGVPPLAGTAVQQIINSYRFNPFVRIWGY